MHWSSRLGVAGPAFVGGLLVAFSLPPWGWWPLAWLGIGVLALVLAGGRRRRYTPSVPSGPGGAPIPGPTSARPAGEGGGGLGAKRRVLAGVAFGLGQFVVGLWWMGEFQAAGAGLVMLLETGFIALACWAVPRGWTFVALPAALVVAEWVRGEVPFEGLPMAGVALGQVSGPFGGSARLGGALLVLGLAALVGSGLAAVVAGRGRLGWALLVAAAGGGVLGWAAPDGGGSVRPLDVAVVQGGGPRGFRAVDTDPQDVFDRHVQASALVREGVDLVLWPEDVIDIDRPIEEAFERGPLGALSERVGAPVVAGVVEDAEAGTKFRNAAVLWEGDQITDRYDKVHRVPFGEYVPGRSLIGKLVDLSVIPRDAIPGTTPPVLRPRSTGPLGVVISYEVYFADRARHAVRSGGRVLLVPTNAASFTTSQVPTTEVAAAQLRAIETGRDLAQAAPTGYGALIDHQGKVVKRSVLGRQEVLRGTLHERTGRTVYSTTGDWPVLLLALLVVAWAWAAVRRASK